jgi:AcrR family transcriptional regulator
MTTAESRTDGRTARAQRTREAVVAAMLGLVDEGHLRPTARQVSERAGVSLRSVFQHFADLETLFAEAADLQVSRLQSLAVRIHGDLPFEQRIERFVEARSSLLEAVTPVRRAALLQAPFSAVISARLEWARELNHGEVARVFAPEFATLAPESRERSAAALKAATDWYTWETLRAHQGLSLAEARNVMSHTIRALLRKEGD